jgi:hypothetical protein
VSSAGRALCWGSNEYGELGNGASAESGFSGGNVPQAVLLNQVYETVSAGDRFTCALQPGSTGRCWGRGVEGQLGNGQPIIIFVPLRMADGLRVSSITTGYTHGCALGPGRRVHCWGDGSRGQLGTMRVSATHVPSRVHIPRD